MNLDKKGQAVIEFLMNYGWAILAVITAIMGLAYFGVISPPKYSPSICTVAAGFNCEGTPIFTTNNVTFALKNGRTFIITNPIITGFSGLNCDAASSRVCGFGVDNCPVNIGMVAPGDIVTVALSCSYLSDSIAEGEIRMMYTNPESLLVEGLTVRVAGRVH